MKYVATIAGLLMTVIGLAAGEEKVLFEQANDYYEREHFDSAIAMYDSVMQIGYTSATLHYNLGNAHYRAGHVAPAVYHYEKALKLNPGMEDARFNLQIARLKTVDKLQPPQRSLIGAWWRHFLRTYTSDQWATYTTVFLWVAFGLFVLYLLVSNRAMRIFGFVAGSIVLVLAMVTFLINLAHNDLQQASQEAIVFAPNIYVKSEPSPSSTDLFIIHEGLKLQVLDETEEWYQIRLRDEKQGWIKKDAVKVI